ncbi:MAG: hypothetical protein ABW199_08340 [Caulobacterales bacterium]
MLHSNANEVEPGEDAEDHARHAHLAHAAVVGMHAICCGAPIALLIFTSAAATAAGGAITALHAFLHGHELWLIGISAALVSIGGYAEWRVFRAGARRFPWLFALSCACFVANVAILWVHRAH